MYRFLVFTYSDYYPAGGMSDCILKTNDFIEIPTALDQQSSEYVDIYDVETDKNYDSFDKLMDDLNESYYK